MTARAQTEDLRNALAAYGARLGIVEPLLHGMANHIPELDDIIAELRAKKEYAISDRLRAVVQQMRENASYAFPGRYP